MSEQYSHLTGGPAAPTTQPGWEPQPPRKKRGRKIAVFTGLAFATVIGIGVANSGSGSSQENASIAQGSSSSAPATQPSTQAPAAPAAPAAPQPTVAQQQALESAQSYLDMGTGFSRAGLIDQLSSSAGEGFSHTDAVWAVNHSPANWKEQAVESAKGYLQMGGFSRASLIDQLSSSAGEQFTVAQATYAADQVGL